MTKVGKGIHQSSCFHLETKHAAKLRAKPVSGKAVLYDLVNRRYCAIVDNNFLTSTLIPLYLSVFATLSARRSFDVFGGRLK
jgi:hypothetical protein